MKNAIINSSLALTSAYIITILLHELAHFLPAIMLGYDATLFHNRVLHSGVENVWHSGLIAGAGPLFSLLQALICFKLIQTIRSDYMALFLLWMAISGFVMFFGYVMIGPFVPIGDTGKVFALIGLPVWVQILLAILASAFLVVILLISGKKFERFSYTLSENLKNDRIKWANGLIMFPLFISIALVTLLQFPIPHIVSILPTTMAPFSIMTSYGAVASNKHPLPVKKSAVNMRIAKGLLLVFILSIAINRLLVMGLSI